MEKKTSLKARVFKCCAKSAKFCAVPQRLHRNHKKTSPQPLAAGCPVLCGISFFFFFNFLFQFQFLSVFTEFVSVPSLKCLCVAPHLKADVCDNLVGLAQLVLHPGHVSGHGLVGLADLLVNVLHLIPDLLEVIPDLCLGSPNSLLYLL